MILTWSEEKERRNLRKHGLGFSLAELVLADPLAVTAFDRVVDGEERWHTVGGVPAGGSFRVLLVVHSFPEPYDEAHIRIISLRQADTRERRRYENHPL